MTLISCHSTLKPNAFLEYFTSVKSTIGGRGCVILAGRTLGWCSVHQSMQVCTRSHHCALVCTNVNQCAPVNVPEKRRTGCGCRQDTEQILSELHLMPLLPDFPGDTKLTAALGGHYSSGCLHHCHLCDTILLQLARI